MLKPHIITTSNQKVLSLLAKYSDQEFYEREVARRLGVSSGSANRALNELFSSGVVTRRREGKMYFYSVNSADAVIIEFKKLVNMMLIESLIQDLKAFAHRIILYGSCAQGTDTSRSDLDLFIVSDEREKVLRAIESFAFPQGFENVKIQPVVKTSLELLKAEDTEQAFLEEAEQGIVLWDKRANEPGF